MEKIYHAGEGPGPVTVAVQVGSPVPSVTLVYLVIPGNPNKVLGTSDPDTGNVATIPVGIPPSLHGTHLVCQTTLLCSTLDPDEWPQVPNVLSIHYTLDGGTEGTIAFGFDKADMYVSETGKVIVVTQEIKIQ
jgi:hypothetical protein